MSEFINLFDIPEIAEKVRKEESLTESVEFGIPELKKYNV